jgi:hypothetical protein
LRDDIALDEQAESTVTPDPVISTPAASAATAQAAPEPEPPMPEEELPDEEMEMNEFMEFLMQISSSAFIYLGMMEHPATGTRQLNLPAAKQSIDMLVLLRQKTRGNLTRDEERFFDGLLSDLQMQYVALSNRMGMR